MPILEKLFGVHGGGAKKNNHGSPTQSSKHHNGNSGSVDMTKSPHQGGYGAVGAAPDSAQNANYAAFQPPGATDSMAGKFAGGNPAAAAGSPQQQGINSTKHKGYSPGLTATNAQNQNYAGIDNRERAQQMVEQERAHKSKLPLYEGLPSNLELLEKMGDGAFSNVYKAYDKLSRRKVAVKCVRKYELNSSQAGGKHVHKDMKKKPRATERANILKEVQIMRGLRHPGIVELLAFTESRDHYFLVLELMEAGELFHQIVKLTYFSEDLSRHVILQVANSIRYLHEERGVVHRDIKPENLLFDPIPIIPSKVSKARPYDEEKEDEGEFIPGVGGGGIGRVKIADFGLSKIVWNEETMTPCGTVGYTAPEIVKDERYSKSVDMWALGCVLYTLLCGFPPFYDESINVLTEKVARGYYTFLSPWWDDISASSKDLITHLLCVDPEKRYTIDQFLAHPWCNEKPAVNPTSLAAKSAIKPGVVNSMPVDSPLLQDMAMGGRVPMRSPGINTLREAFDITYAVHRMEEEGARRRAYNGPGGAGQRGFLNGLNEDDEDSDDAQRDIDATKRRYGEGVAQILQQQAAKAQADAAAGKVQQSTGQYQGWGGADRKMAEAVLYDGRAGSRDRARQGGNNRKGFELTLNNATLLGKRANKPSPLGQAI